MLYINNLTTKDASGIYKITCLTTGKIYIGSAVSLKRRYKRHYNDLLKQKHCNYYLQRSFNKYGEQAFTFEVLEIVSKDSLLSVEESYISQLNSTDFNIGFNLCSVGFSRIGTKHTEDTLKKLSKARQGYKHSEEVKQKIAESNRGKKLSEETKLKISLKVKERDNNPFKGKSHTEDTKEHLRQLKIGSKASEETKLKMSANNTGSSNPSSKLNEDSVKEIRRLHSEGNHTVKELADLFNVAKGTLEKVIYYQTWKHI